MVGVSDAAPLSIELWLYTWNIKPNPRADFEESRKATDYSKARSMIGWEMRV